MTLVSYFLSRSQFPGWGSVVISLSFPVSAYALIVTGSSQEPAITLFTTIPVGLVISSVLLPARGLALLVALNTAIIFALPSFVSSMTLATAGRDGGNILTIGVLLIVVTLFRNALERTRLDQVKTANQELVVIQATLEQRVADRTADLEQRSAYLRASAEVGRAAISILEVELLTRQVVDLIRTSFGLYYVGLFLVDDVRGAPGEWAVLKAGTGEAGRQMLARGHRLSVGEGSMVGWSIAHAQARVAQVAAEDAMRLATAELPHTRSEAALPLRSRGLVVGALTVQSDQPDVFDENALAVLQIMADQVAVAVDNARLFAASQTALDAERRVYGQVSRQAWQEFLRTQAERGYTYAQKSVQPDSSEWTPEMLQATQTGQLTQATAKSALAVPLKVRDQVVGVLDLRKEDSGAAWTEEEQTLVNTLADQFSLALESARLYEDTQRRATQERLVGEITARMRESLDMETVLKTAAEQIRQSLGMDKVTVRLASDEATGNLA
jgi:GAF domain-containing protein